MNCPNCGADIPEGSTFCTNCGAALTADQGYANPGDAMFDQAAYQPEEAPKKKKTGLIIGIIAAVAVVAVALILIFVVGIFNSTDGHYVCDDFSAFGMDFYIDVDGDEFDMVMEAYGEKETESGTIKFDGDTVTMTVDGEDVVGTYNKKDQTITISEDDMGMSITFTKE